ncbi:hypothetical protein TWF281_009688 [Arthrobotrys megalospora]
MEPPHWMHTFKLRTNSSPAHLSFNRLPPELLEDVFSYLPKRDLKRFSKVSKCFRIIVFPYLFREVRLDAGSIKEFNEGGVFHEYQNSVRHITLDPLDPFEEETPLMREYFQTCTSPSTLSLFPKLNSIGICLCAHESAHPHYIFSTILTRISEHPIYSKIKSITLRDVFNAPFLLKPKTLTGANGIEFGYARTGPIPLSINVPYPPSLTSLKLLESDVFTFKQPDLGDDHAHAVSFPNLYLLDGALTTTLRRLEIDTQLLTLPTAKTDMWTEYSAVRDLKITFGCVRGKLIEGLNLRFPYVTDLQLLGNTEKPQGDEYMYMHLVCFQNLKRFKSAWPLGDITDPESMLPESVKFWVAGGCAELKTVEFMHMGPDTSLVTKPDTPKSELDTGWVMRVRDAGTEGWQLEIKEVTETGSVMKYYEEGEIYPWPPS